VEKGITFVGLDAHKRDIAVAVLLPRRKTAEEWTVRNETRALRKMVRKIEKLAPGEVRCCYEAGVCGFALQRQLEGFSRNGLVCEVIAPSLIPRKPGDRIKTDRRDAKKLAERGMFCCGCPMAMMETLEQGCEAHGVDVDEVVKELNDGK